MHFFEFKLNSNTGWRVLFYTLLSLRDEWSSVKKKWFPRTDEHQDFDKRTPGN